MSEEEEFKQHVKVFSKLDYLEKFSFKVGIGFIIFWVLYAGAWATFITYYVAKWT